jgi:hypothetical protein
LEQYLDKSPDFFGLDETTVSFNQSLRKAAFAVSFAASLIIPPFIFATASVATIAPANKSRAVRADS